MSKLAEIAKALLASAIAGLGSLAAVLVGDASLGDVTDGQWATIVLATLVALGGVWGIPNKPPA
jgi:hypothetical protein